MSWEITKVAALAGVHLSEKRQYSLAYFNAYGYLPIEMTLWFLFAALLWVIRMTRDWMCEHCDHGHHRRLRRLAPSSK